MASCTQFAHGNDIHHVANGNDTHHVAHGDDEHHVEHHVSHGKLHTVLHTRLQICIFSAYFPQECLKKWLKMTVLALKKILGKV